MLTRCVERTLEAIGTTGLVIDEHIVVGTEWGEWSHERTGKARRSLVHLARLRRWPDRYIEEFGRAAYDGMVGDCLWSVYGMIGELSRHVFVLSAR